jgi:flagellar biosynthesis protein FliR
MVAFFLASVSLGLLSRTMPQLHLMQLGITANLLIGMGLLLVGFAGWAMVSQDAWGDYFGTLREVLRQ